MGAQGSLRSRITPCNSMTWIFGLAPSKTSNSLSFLSHILRPRDVYFHPLGLRDASIKSAGSPSAPNPKSRFPPSCTKVRIGSPSRAWPGYCKRKAQINNTLYFHQHRQRVILTRFISSTSRESHFRAFFLHLFSITSPDLPSYFPPAFFMRLATDNKLTILFSARYISARFSEFINNLFCF